MDAAIAIARAKLARELNCEPDVFVVDSAEAVTWSDSSLGCPEPGMMYMQVLTPGYRITLTQGGQHYTLHTDNGRRAVRCARLGRPVVGEGPV